jgi:hypothetical protein
LGTEFWRREKPVETLKGLKNTLKDIGGEERKFTIK